MSLPGLEGKRTSGHDPSGVPEPRGDCQPAPLGWEISAIDPARADEDNVAARVAAGGAAQVAMSPNLSTLRFFALATVFPSIHALPGADASQPIDTTVRLVTPERVVFTYPLAGPCRRGLAYGVDLVCILFLIGLSLALAFVLTWGHAAGLGLGYALLFGLIWGYGAFSEGVFNGQTIGKYVMGLRVMSTQGIPITGAQATIRNLIGTVDGPFPFLFVPGLVSMILTRRFQRLGDLAAGTMVVIEEVKRAGSIRRITDDSLGDVLTHLPARVAAGPAQSKALADYVKHRGGFSDSRREEIARHLARPLRDRHALPPTATNDAILCAFYHRLYLGE